MPLWQVVVLAVVQGVTEFLPISSTAHLALVPWLFHWNDPGLSFDVALHVGTLVAVLLFFYKTWVDLLLLGLGRKPFFATSPAGAPNSSQMNLNHNRLLFWFLVIGTIPAGLAGWVFHDLAATSWRHPVVIGSALILVAIPMAWGERVSRYQKDLPQVSFTDSLIIGICQALALVPGVSRSGITMTAALFRDFRREAAARFSFLLSTPIIAGAALNEFLNLRQEDMPPEMRVPFLVGIIVSAVVGYAAIALLLKYLQYGTFKIFVYYRVIFGIIVLALAFFV
ncbi:MAG: UDP-diphosphatase [Acidobacteria bacterium RIFCSPLOWO2_02_FULL_59_13]|nr:MAG: UDP-diphosphatase [Acidobacteria bacterium RIFCSPLOWO2_02_FULL_59_13]